MKVKVITRATAAAIAVGAALALAPGAWAHARVSPPVVEAKSGQVFGLAVPTENANSFTTQVELTLPKGFSIDSFVPSPNWKRSVQKHGSGDTAREHGMVFGFGLFPGARRWHLELHAAYGVHGALARCKPHRV